MQKRFINYKDPITSFGANEKLSGILFPTVYTGFDEIVPGSGLNFTLNHNLTGEIFTNQNLTPTPPRGIWVTRQGTVIKEDAPIPLTIETNTGNASKRWDYLIGYHNHDVLYPGGTGANYEIIKGPTGSFTPPIMPNSTIYVILGRFEVDANSSSITGVKWVRNRTSVPGGKLPSLLLEDNRYQAQQQEYQTPEQVTSTSTDFEILARGVITKLDKANSFVVNTGFEFLDLLPDKPNGTKISLLFKANTKIRNFINNLSGQKEGTGLRVGYSQGYRGIVFNEVDVNELLIYRGQIVELIKVESFNTFTPTANPPVFVYGDYWKLVNVSDTPLRVKTLESAVSLLSTELFDVNTKLIAIQALINNINPPRLIQDIDFIGNMLAHFDNTGKAKPDSPYYGRAICNGQNSTPDYRGRFRVSYSDTDYDYNSVGFIGGQKFVTLSIYEMPTHSHTIPYTAIGTNDYGGGSNIGGRGYNSGNQTAYKNSQTQPYGGGQAHENRPPYKVALTLMWIGIV